MRILLSEILLSFGRLLAHLKDSAWFRSPKRGSFWSGYAFHILNLMVFVVFVVPQNTEGLCFQIFISWFLWFLWFPEWRRNNPLPALPSLPWLSTNLKPRLGPAWPPSHVLGGIFFGRICAKSMPASHPCWSFKDLLLSWWRRSSLKSRTRSSWGLTCMAGYHNYRLGSVRFGFVHRTVRAVPSSVPTVPPGRWLEISSVLLCKYKKYALLRLPSLKNGSKRFRFRFQRLKIMLVPEKTVPTVRLGFWAIVQV